LIASWSSLSDVKPQGRLSFLGTKSVLSNQIVNTIVLVSGNFIGMVGLDLYEASPDLWTKLSSQKYIQHSSLQVLWKHQPECLSLLSDDDGSLELLLGENKDSKYIGVMLMHDLLNMCLQMTSIGDQDDGDGSFRVTSW